MKVPLTRNENFLIVLIGCYKGTTKNGRLVNLLLINQPKLRILVDCVNGEPIVIRICVNIYFMIVEFSTISLIASI